VTVASDCSKFYRRKKPQFSKKLHRRSTPTVRRVVNRWTCPTFILFCCPFCVRNVYRKRVTEADSSLFCRVNEALSDGGASFKTVAIESERRAASPTLPSLVAFNGRDSSCRPSLSRSRRWSTIVFHRRDTLDIWRQDSYTGFARGTFRESSSTVISRICSRRTPWISEVGGLFHFVTISTDIKLQSYTSDSWTSWIKLSYVFQFYIVTLLLFIREFLTVLTSLESRCYNKRRR